MKKENLSFTKEEFLAIYREMLLLRRFEENAGQLYGMGLIGGFCHLYIGQEAVAVGIKRAIKNTDTIITSYRDHGLMLSAGGCPKSIMAELLGKSTGCSKGKGGSMHMFDLEKGFYGGHGIVGAQVSLGTGLAFAHKYKDTDNISVTLYGDGASHQGQVYESFNIAKLWGLPVLYIIENNEYAMGTSVERASSTKELYKRGESFGITGKQVDGMNFFAVYEAVKEAADFIRKNSTPFLLEMKTYRYRGHSMSDPAKYRAKEEVEEYKAHHDPLTSLKEFFAQNQVVSEEELKAIEVEVKEIVKESAEFAQTSPEPDEEELYTNVYKD
ncbi:pyruvate dehydrogenase (acetyl-transferring) E1 component subunit alpha [Candidatus Bandiella euplotis]|uniref:Pyruvate dehydrogenase E1 component subunit alpha n=1 Tax=Candidatus Bandiella euplotis TaxID=1664265 RepID=A0ABZ0UK73_9RICK|nr:pyruvate dehydrogenase (acetyl-transferring) E1 component subunit alpha [Candidatus Bandiella woodruffii]WPX96342.1 Pyruvate dehydrogenase E1 component subunit alpha [Candidatus Bandiella woodruffii]